MSLKTILCRLAGLILLAGCVPSPHAQDGSALTATPAVLPQAHAALAEGQYAAAIALAEPWAATSAEAAGLLAEAHLAQAEPPSSGGPDSPAARRPGINVLALAWRIAPNGELKERIAGHMAELASDSPTAATATPEQVATPAQAAHPQPQAPRRPAYAIAQRKSFEGSGESGQFASCVDIQVVAGGQPVAGAVVGVNNGEHSYQSQTDGSGYTGRCGLGASTWSVVLFWAPGAGDSGATTTVYLSGAPEQRAAVVFTAP